MNHRNVTKINDGLKGCEADLDRSRSDRLILLKTNDNKNISKIDNLMNLPEGCHP